MSVGLIERNDSKCATEIMSEKPTVYIIDDDRDLRRSLHFLLGTANITSRPFGAAEDFLDEMAMLAPGPILLDIRMPGMDGLQTLTALRQRNLTWPVIIMTAHGDIALAVRAMKLGAIEFLEKPFAPEMLDKALAQALTVLARTQQAAGERAIAQRRLGSLSPRETEVVTLLADGLPNKEVAHRLSLSTRTVEMHRSNALSKLSVKSVAEVVALMMTSGSPAARA